MLSTAFDRGLFTLFSRRRSRSSRRLRLRCFRQKFDDPRSVLDLVERVACLIVGLLLPPHLEQDLEPPLAQAPQRLGVAHPLLAFFLVVRLGPGALQTTAVAPL